MLKLAIYEENILEFLNSTTSSKGLRAVCPSPAKADIFRDLLIQANHSSNIEVTTISNFVKSNLSTEDSEKIGSKSSLLLDLWTIWKVKISSDYTDFRRVFDLFTEIRSFSCEIHLLEELDSFFKESERKGVHLFYQYLKATEKLDEQDAYNMVSKVEDGVDIILWGYDHLNANQIQMFKRIGQSVDVFIPISKYVYSRCTNSDWPYWLTTEEFEPLVLTPKEIKAIIFPENRASQYLDSLSEIGVNDFYYLVLDSELTALSLASQELYFKSSVDIFSDELNIFFEELLTQDFKNISQKMNALINEALGKKHFVRLKMLIQFKELLESFTSLSAANEELIIDDLYCLREKITLDLPRTAWITLSKESKQSVLSCDYLLLNTINEKAAIYITKSMAKSFQTQNKFTPEIKSVLASYGPIQSKNVLLNTLKFQMYNFANTNGVLFIEDNAFEHLLEWEDLKDLLRLKTIQITSKINTEHEILVEDKLIESMIFKSSATALQNYLDCPRKYYYSYIGSLDINAKGELTLTPDVLGTIEHTVIETAVGKMNRFNSVEFESIVFKCFEARIKALGISLSKSSYRRFSSEVIAHTHFVTDFLIELRNSFGVELFFEYDLSLLDNKYRGRIDLLIKSGDSFTLIDFKRSKSSIPTTASLLNYKKIQLWYYISGLQGTGFDVDNFGYLSLSNLADSLIFTNSDNNLSKQLENLTKISKIDDWQNRKKIASDLIDTTEDKIKNDKFFSINPISLDVCSYCVANSVCSKSGLEMSGALDKDE